MESQLNPNAAEFVPVYGAALAIDTDISHSPRKQSEIRSLEKVKVPTAKEFLKDIAKRPSDIDELGENDKTVNGELNNISTKAVLGDDSECLDAATVDSSLLQNESLISTNPFGSSHVPNFVQDHFSPDFNGGGLDFLGSGDNGTQEFTPVASDEAEADQRSKQNSPLLRESPEPGLHNGQGEEGSSPEPEEEQPPTSPTCPKEDTDISKPSETATETAVTSLPQQDSEPVPDQAPAASLIDNTFDQSPPSFFQPTLSPVDHGPETCVDSESEDDVLVSPSKKESNLESERKFTEDLVNKAFEPHSSLAAEATNASQMNDKYFEELLRNSETVVCKGMTAKAFVALASEYSEKNEKVDDLMNDFISDSELVEENEEGDLVQVTYEAIPMSAEQVILGQSPLPVEEVCLKKEVHEELISPVKEDVLFEDSHKQDKVETSQEQDESEDFILHKNNTFDDKLNNEDVTDEIQVVNGLEHNSVSELHHEKNSPFEFGTQQDFFCNLQKENVVHNKTEEDIVCPLRKEEVCSLPKEEEITSFENSFVGQMSSLSKENSDPLPSEPERRYHDEEFCPMQKDSISMQISNKAESEFDRPSSPADFSKIGQNIGIHYNEENVFRAESIFDEKKESVCEKPSAADTISAPEKSSELYTLKNDSPIEDKLVSFKNEDYTAHKDDEMSSSMIDHGEEKSLPEPQSNQLNIMQDLQFEVQDKNEADTESDSGFEIINASEASTIELEMRIQSEKEAGAVDEKLLLDRNEAEVEEKSINEVAEAVIEVSETSTEKVADEKVPEAAIEKVAAETLTKKTEEAFAEKEIEVQDVMPAAGTDELPTPIEPVVNGGTVMPPATPSAESDVDNVLLVSAVAAAGIGTVVAGAAAAIADSKVDEKKKPASPKKAEPIGKPGVAGKAPPSKPVPKATTAVKASTTKAPLAAVKSTTTKPSAVTAPSTARPGSASSKPTTPTTRTAAKPASKPSTPTTAKAPAASSPALKSKPTATSPTKPAAAASAKSSAAKPATLAAKKPTTPISSTAKPSSVSTAKTAPSKPGVSTTASKPATKPAVSAAAKPASSAVKSTTAPKPTAPSARPPVKATSTTKPIVSSTTAKTPTKTTSAVGAKPASTVGAKALSSTAAKPAPTKITSATATKAPAGTKPPTATKTVPAKTPAAPLNKKPAAPTAIKKPAAPTEKSVKEANNKLASTKTKKVEESKIISKTEEIIENVEPLTQDPVITTTNGHISPIENGIPTPEIVAEGN